MKYRQSVHVRLPLIADARPRWWNVYVVVESDPVPDLGGQLIDAPTRTKILGVLDEYRNRPLETIIVPGHPTIAGLAAVLMERLSVFAPVWRVTVVDWETKDGFSVERT